MPTKVRLSKNDLASFKTELRAMYLAHEITPDQYATLTEDIAVIERRK